MPALLAAAAAAAAAASVERWGAFELSLSHAAGSAGNPFTDVSFGATFAGTSDDHRVDGFYDGGSDWRVRFMPPTTGSWTYTTFSNVAELDGKKGSFSVSAAGNNNHGPVRVRDYRRLQYADGESHFSVGTTSYAWIHQNDTIIANTVATLGGSSSPFNKMRMTIFPKWYEYNHNEPLYYPYDGTAPSTWDFTRFNVSFWKRLDQRVDELLKAGVEADLILFHPYDNGHWGFDCMGGRDAASYSTANDELYLRYIVARLGSRRNVWWSMANEWDLVGCKGTGVPDTSPTWDALFRTLAHADPYGHLTSIHNCVHYYDQSRPWITHISSQGGYDLAHIKRKYTPKPLIWDEVMYEGDIPSGWGGLTAGQMVDRFWWGLSYGAYVGHGETILLPGTSDNDQVLWWSKGNVLRGGSPPRIGWFRGGSWGGAQAYFDKISCTCTGWGSTLCDDSCTLQYTMGDGVNIATDEASFYFVHSSAYNQPAHRPPDSTLTLPQGTWEVRMVDFYGMRVVTPAVATLSGGPQTLAGALLVRQNLTNADTTAPCGKSSASCCSDDAESCTPYIAMLVRTGS